MTQPSHPVAPVSARALRPSSMRQRIRAVLEQAPGWMTRHAIEEAVHSEHPLGDTLQKMARGGLIRSNTHGHYQQAEALAAHAAAARAEEIIQQGSIPESPRGDLEIRILETLRAYYPMPIAPVQMAVMVGESRARVLAFMQALATLGTIARPTRSFYQHIPQGEGGIDA